MKSMRRRIPLLATVLAVAAALAYSTLSALLAVRLDQLTIRVSASKSGDDVLISADANATS